MSIARLTSLGALATLASCSLYHPALEPMPNPQNASVSHNGTDYLVAELENPTPAPSVTAPSLPVVPPTAPTTTTAETLPAVASVAPIPTTPQPAPTPTESQPTPASHTPPKAAPKPAPQPAPTITAKPTPTPPPAIEKTKLEIKPAPPSPQPTVAASRPLAPTDLEADARRAEEFAIMFANILFPSDGKTGSFPTILSPTTLTPTHSPSDSGTSSLLLDKVRKNLARASAVERAPTPWASQPSTAAKVPGSKPLEETSNRLDSSIESLSIIPGETHDDRIDFGLDLGPTSSFDFGATKE
ncbi:MAG: hypothetical protein P8J87_00895 [Verrucomicrobiales bacterium]|nr:hypothetical protein [Verrucomicrobiales bacterium]